MAPQRDADAANAISPYRERDAAGQSSQSSERPRNGKGKKPKPQARPERNPRPLDEDPRFNLAPRNINALASRAGRRTTVTGGRVDPNGMNHFSIPQCSLLTMHIIGIPDYPPPSFQEAIMTLPSSVASSVVSLVSPTPVPTNIPESSRQVPDTIQEVPEPQQETVEDSVERAAVSSSSREGTSSLDGSDLDDDISIIDSRTIPISSTDLPSGRQLTAKIQLDWRKRRGVDFPGFPPLNEDNLHKSADSLQDAQKLSRGRTIKAKPSVKIDIDPEAVTEDDLQFSPQTPKKRFLSLSPLRTFFPPRSPAHQERAMTAQPGSPQTLYSASKSTFFRSSSSLAAPSFLKLPSSSPPKNDSSRSRKIFPSKGKDRLDAWEVLDGKDCDGVDTDGKPIRRSLTNKILSGTDHVKETASPTRSLSFSFGHPLKVLNRSRHNLSSLSQDTLSLPSTKSKGYSPPRRYKSEQTEGMSSISENLEPHIEKQKSISTPTTPSVRTCPELSDTVTSIIYPTPEHTPIPTMFPINPVNATLIAGAPVQTVAVQAGTRVIYLAPIRVESKPNLLIDQKGPAIATYHKALHTPLPESPERKHFDLGLAELNSSQPHAADHADPLANIPVLTPTPKLKNIPLDLLTDSNPVVAESSCSCHNVCSTHAAPVPSSPNLRGIVSSKSSSSDEPMTPTRHHYGRPLPRPPPTSSPSLGADGPSLSWGQNNIPEGLLIDLDDNTFDNYPPSGTTTPRLDDPRSRSQTQLPTMISRTPSFDQLIESPNDHSSVQISNMQSFPPPSNYPGSPRPPAASPSNGYSDLTQLDLLVSQLSQDNNSGSDYEVSSSGRGHNTWSEPGFNSNRYVDAAPSLRNYWSRESSSHPRAAASNIYLPEAQRQYQRQHIPHRAY